MKQSASRGSKHSHHNKDPRQESQRRKDAGLKTIQQELDEQAKSKES